MIFRNEQDAVKELAELVLDAAANLFKATKYIYSLSKSDFYSCDVKDAFKVVLNNIFDAGALRALNLSMEDSTCGEMNGPEYSKVFSLLVYSFAVRLPALCNVTVSGASLSDRQVRDIYDAIIVKGVVNHSGAVQESFEELRLCVKKGRPIPPYAPDWYKTYLFEHVPALGDISNRSMFLFGTVDTLLVLFYLRLEQELERRIGELGGKMRQSR